MPETLTNLKELSQHDRRCVAVIDKAILHRRTKQYREGMRELIKAEQVFEYSDNRILKAKNKNILAQLQAGVARTEKDAEYFDKARFNFGAALAYLEAEEVRDYLSIAAILNNLANTLLELGETDEAHARVDRAERIFNDAGEQAWLAQVYDTRAKVYIAQGIYKEAVRWASRAVLILMDGVERDPYEEAKATLELALKLLRGQAGN
jgi:tetratricopeptide (TPR) repeat protein